MRLGTYALIVLITSVFTVQANAAEYTALDLGTLGGTFSYGLAINNKGQATGWSSIGPKSAQPYHPFVFDKGHLKDVGKLGTQSATAYGINDLGQVAGTLTKSNGLGNSIIISDESMKDLGAFGGKGSAAFGGINTSGQVTGDFYLQNPTPGGYINRAYLYSDGKIKDIGTLGGDYSWARGLNDAGQVVGSSELKANARVPRHAFLYVNGKMQDIGTLGGDSSGALGINSKGDIVGTSSYNQSGHSHGFLYSNGALKDIGTIDNMDCEAHSINNLGQIVGNLRGSKNGGFIYKNGKMDDLAKVSDLPENWTIREANGINDAGQIIVTCDDTAKKIAHAFILTPVTAQPPSK